MNELLKDFRYGLRMLYKTPGLSLVAIVTIALGVGAVTLTLAGLLACIVPALRATRVNLVDALRAE
jgi:ABC-type antimicrobial peptide transport system permease subunit